MNLRRVVLLSALALAVLATPAAAQMEVDLGVVVGVKQLDDNDVGGADDQTQYGVGAFFGGSDWPVKIATDLRFSSGDDSTFYSYGGYSYGYTIDVETTELTVGVVKLWGDRIQPYIGAGLAYVKLDGKVDVVVTGPPAARGIPAGTYTLVDDDDSELGYYAGAGVLFALGERFSLGLDVRYSDAEAELTANTLFRGVSGESGTLDSGGPQYGVRIGYHW